MDGFDVKTLCLVLDEALDDVKKHLEKVFCVEFFETSVPEGEIEEWLSEIYGLQVIIYENEHKDKLVTFIEIGTYHKGKLALGLVTKIFEAMKRSKS